MYTIYIIAGRIVALKFQARVSILWQKNVLNFFLKIDSVFCVKYRKYNNIFKLKLET